MSKGALGSEEGSMEIPKGKVWAITISVIFLAVSLCPKAQTAPADPGVAATSKAAALTNADVVKMVQLGLSEEVVVAKIKEANTVNFDTGINALEELKKDGVSADEITAMLHRKTAPEESSPAKVQDEKKVIVEVQGVHLGPTDVVLCSKKGNFKLRSTQGSLSNTFAFITVLVYSDFPGLNASVRVKDRQPSILLRSDESPAGRYFYVKAKRDKGDDVRSVKMGRVHVFSAKSMTSPDKDWVVKTKVIEEKPGVWRLTPAKPLKPGEYGLWVIGTGPEMYDFGIDK